VYCREHIAPATSTTEALTRPTRCMLLALGVRASVVVRTDLITAPAGAITHMEDDAPPLSDEELALEVACGERDALLMLIRDYGPNIEGFLKTKFENIWEDALQDFYLKLPDKITQYKPELGSLKSWLIKMAQNCAIDIYRGEKDHAAAGLIEEAGAVENHDPPTPLTPKQRKKRLRKHEQIQEAINDLPPIERRVMVALLAFYKGDTWPDEKLPAKELAAEWGTTANAVSQAKSRALARLEKELVKRGVFTEGGQS